MATISAWHIIIAGLTLALAIGTYYKMKDLKNSDNTID